MAVSTSPSSWLLPCLIVVLFFARPTRAFGAGNIGSTSEIEGQNWRHGDIEDTLLTLLISRAAGGKKFSQLDVKRVYFGNWLRDYSQAVDVGTVKYVSAEAIRILLWVLGFLSFGYGTKEFEVTTARLGCYRPEEHIDNPKDYADNEDARQYDHRLRGPVDERRELAIDPQTGMRLKAYIASENAGITTSAGLIRKLFGRSIQLGRQYARNKNEDDLFEALRLLGTGCHCLEDYSAHSNYTELTLIELGERDVFPHVGRQTQIQLRGAHHPVYPIITGTFGGVDFLHSVMGELSDKATQSEIQELEGTITSSQNSGQNLSLLQDLLSKLPDGMFGGEDQAGKASELQANAQAAQMQHTRISPRQPEEWTRHLEDIQNQIRPILEFHDNLMKGITEFVEKIPVLPALLDQISSQISIFVFSLMAPFVLPIINQVKTELATGSSEIIKSSQEKQLIVFRDDRSSNPTHSMLSKDHFSNILNEPAGRVASQVLKWVVPQLIAAWDDERVDVERTLNRIIHGVLHHPALRTLGDDGAADGRRLMFQVVEKWWGEKDERERQQLRDQLSRSGVEQGRNHKEGVHDTGHGCGKPLGLPNMGTSQSSGAIGGPAAGAVLGGLSALGNEFGGSGGQGRQSGGSSGIGNIAGEAVGGGVLGGLVGGLVGGVGSDLLGGAFGGDKDDREQYKSESYGKDGSYSQTYTDVGRHNRQSQGDESRWGQAQYTKTEYPSGEERESYQRYEQGGSTGGGGYGFKETVESRPYGGGYERETETSRYEGSGGWQSEVRQEEKRSSGEYRTETQRYDSGGFGGDKRDSDSDGEKRNKHKKYHQKSSGDDSDNEMKNRRSSGRYENQSSYGGPQQRQSASYSQNRRDDDGQNYGRQQEQQQQYGGYGESRREEYDSGDGYGGRREEYGQSRRDEDRVGYGEQGYGETRRGGFGGGFGGGQEREGYGESRGDEYGGGFGRQERESQGYGQEESRYGQDEDNNYGERRSGYGDDY